MAAISAKVEGTARFIEQLEQQLIGVGKGKKSTVVVGYDAYYAIYVHENLAIPHTNGQAKFLEQPARELAPQLKQIASYYLKKGYSLEQAMLIIGLDLQHASQNLVPVDTGYLKGSAYTRPD